MMRKFGPASLPRRARRLTAASEKVWPVGFWYFGTHQMPLISGSLAASRSTSSMSGPSASIRTLIISKPSDSVMVKCRS